MQPLVIDERGIVRFQHNTLVRYLVDHGCISLNQLALVEASDADREQLAQLLGYSVSGFGDLPYARPETVDEADRLAEKISSEK